MQEHNIPNGYSQYPDNMDMQNEQRIDIRYPDFARRFIRLCKEANLPKAQNALGKTFGVSGPTIWCYRNGTKLPSTEKAGEIAKILNTTIDYLINGNPTYQLSEDESRLIQLYRAADHNARRMIIGSAHIAATGHLDDLD